MQRRVLVYAVMAVILFAVWKLYRHEPPPPPDVDTPLEVLDVPDDRPLPPRAQVDPARLSSVRDGSRTERALLEPDASMHLLEECTRLAWGDLDQLGLRAGNAAELARDGAALRGQPFWVLGELQWSVSETIDFLPRTRGEIVDRDGTSWAFLVVVEPFAVEPGDVVRLSGFYLKQYELLRPSGEFVTAPLLVGEELLASAYRIEPVTALREDLFDDLRDRDLDQANRPLECMAYYELLSYALHGSTEGSPSPALAAPELRPSDLLAAPDDWRGQRVHMTGSLIYMKRSPLGPRGENPLGEPFVWELWITDARAGEIGTMLALSLREPQGVAERQIVEVEGYFFRRWAFENRANHPRMVPVIMASSIERFVPREDTLTPLLVRISLGMVIVVAAIIVYAQRRERRAERAQRDKRVRRKGKLLSSVASRPAVGGSGTGAPATAGAPARPEAAQDVPPPDGRTPPAG